jgi:hypothetical protein
MEANAPPPWLTFLIMFGLLALAIGAIVLIGGVSRLLKGQSFWPPEDGARPSVARSHVRALRVRRGSHVRARSQGANATLRHQDGTFAGSEGSRSTFDVHESSGSAEAITPDLPQTMEELIWAIEAVRLRTSGEESTKEAAIIRAFPHVNSKGGGAWQRASVLYDTISSAQKTGQGRQAQQQVVEAV